MKKAIIIIILLLCSLSDFLIAQQLPFQLPNPIRKELKQDENPCFKQGEFSLDRYNQFVINEEGKCVKHGKWYYYNFMSSIDQSSYYLGNYSFGKKEGKWAKYVEDHLNGKSYISGIDWYKQDYLTGTSLKYSSTGQILLECDFFKGKINGTVHFYSASGVLLGIYKYEENKLSDITYYKDEGDLFQPKKSDDYYPFRLIEKDGCAYYNIFLSRNSEPMCSDCCSMTN